jgi:molybdopterin synthase sulfur carrier subunit
MTVRLLYFAWVRERVGTDAEIVPLDKPMALAALADLLAARSPGHAAALADLGRLRAAINGEFAPWSATAGPDDEVAIFPPVTGG